MRLLGVLVPHVETLKLLENALPPSSMPSMAAHQVAATALGQLTARGEFVYRDAMASLGPPQRMRRFFVGLDLRKQGCSEVFAMGRTPCLTPICVSRVGLRPGKPRHGLRPKVRPGAAGK